MSCSDAIALGGAIATFLAVLVALFLPGFIARRRLSCTMHWISIGKPYRYHNLDINFLNYGQSGIYIRKYSLILGKKVIKTIENGGMYIAPNTAPEARSILEIPNEAREHDTDLVLKVEMKPKRIKKYRVAQNLLIEHPAT